MFDCVTILAPGLLGASVGLAIKDRNLAGRTHVWARRAETRVKCAEQPWCDAVFEDPGEAARESDLIVVCSPVETIHPLVRRIAGSIRKGAIVTDVGSTKSLICRFCHAVTPAGSHFVGSHPMAGSEKSGMDFATSDLFRGRTCFVTPLVDTDEGAVETVLRFWRDLDMEVTTASPEVHDEIVANISHLPHVLASVLCTYLSTRDENWRNFAGNGLRDTTRIAAGGANLWKSIIEQNREEILRAIDGFEHEMQGIKSAIANNQTFEIINILERGKAYRDRLRPDG